MITNLGKFLRTLRLEENELLKDMARRIDVTPSYLSVIENGRRNMSDVLVRKIAEVYNLSEEQVDKLQSLAIQNRTKLEVDLTDLTEEKQDAARVFYNKLSNLSEDRIRKIIQLIG